MFKGQSFILEHIELPAKLLNYSSQSNKSNINQHKGHLKSARMPEGEEPGMEGLGAFGDTSIQCHGHTVSWDTDHVSGKTNRPISSPRASQGQRLRSTGQFSWANCLKNIRMSMHTKSTA